MNRPLWKDCGCGGDPTCYGCRGTGRIRDREAEDERAEWQRDADRDDRAVERARERGTR